MHPNINASLILIVIFQTEAHSHSSVLCYGLTIINIINSLAAMNIRSLLHRSTRGMLNWRRFSAQSEVPTQEANKLRVASELKPNDQPEFAYNRTYIYPKDYKPYTINNHSDLPLFFTLGLILYGTWRYNKVYLQRYGLDGRDEDVPQYKQ
jgi:hypothetical protein